ncbi:hypothetical protein B0T17DRAFT_495094 [Bombardia bombarda]|uniref:Protein BNI4 n=1 Tax=Bombardia bombarda TaxID=252184 RepID=A0AA40C1E2_9PEZI|nr:hypothetical protein B0T17DRAFT_495094 [Bombardia bombarda]
MAALVQGYPQQSGTVIMLQARPSSASGMISSTQRQAQQNPQQYSHGSQQRNSIHGLPSGVGSPMIYRGNSGPAQPYAFNNTPSLNQGSQWQQIRTYRTTSSPAVPTIPSLDYTQSSAGRPRYSASVSMTNLPSTSTFNLQTSGSRDDSTLSMPGSRRIGTTPQPQSLSKNESSSQQSIAQPTPIRVAPERYRRPALRTADSGSHYASRTVPEQKVNTLRAPHVSLQNRPNSFVGSLSGSAIDDAQLPRGHPQEDIKRFRRRSMPALDSAGFSMPLTPPEVEQPGESNRLDQAPSRKTIDKEPKAAKTGNNNNNNNLTVDRGSSALHNRAGSSDSRSSSRSTGSGSRPSSSANRNANGSNPTANPAPPSPLPDQTGSQDYPRLVSIPPRSSSSDAANTTRVINPSPLSKPAAMDAEAENRRSADTTATAPASPMKVSSPRVESPAVRQLAAINQNGSRAKSKTSRLRRAFSFGSAAEFKKAVPESEVTDDSLGAVHSKLHKERNPDELYNAEQARIAQQQEEAGLGTNIYRGGRTLHGSTDNISISSTASSASIMIRKMGRGMKKGTRSLVGLFRPKSIIGSPADDAALPEATQGTVSLITVEAERERVNISADIHSQNGGGTGFPHLERNSVDGLDATETLNAITERAGSSGTDSSGARKSIVGGDKERAEVLAAVRKGILKYNNGSPSPSPKPSETTRAPVFDMSNGPAMTDSPNSSAPSTPNEETPGHRRSGQVAIGNEDYFISALRLRQDTKSAPGTPHGSTPHGSMKRNATFSPRIAFYETWPSQEYDRRGEIATCNRLTPMLAQQIKEELNSFKMEMEVHENSKIYTHFF